MVISKICYALFDLITEEYLGKTKGLEWIL
jgi:hypothetical protein